MASHPVWAAALGLALALVGKAAAAQDASCGGQDPVGRLVSALGDVRINGRAPTGALPFVPLCEGDLVTVGVESRATAYLLAADTPFRIDEASSVHLLAPGQPSSGLLDLTGGALYFLSEVRRTLTIRTPYISAGVEGTEVYLRVADAGAELIVLEGEVTLTPGARMPADTTLAPAATGDRVVVDAQGEAERGVVPGDGPFGALRRVVVGQLSWTLYYPDILPGVEAAADPRLGEAARLLAAGQADAAEALLAQIGDGGTTAGLRDALLTTIAVARRDGAVADMLAAQAVERAPGQAAPRLALSYARQLALDLDGALAAAQTAAALAPDSPLPPARVAEIHLMRGETRAARAVARQSVARGGGALAAIVQGYADLAALRGARAEQSFRRALELESQNPLALLGLGLSQIKQGDLRAGREQIESAVVHDPSSSLLRSYLGKAYFEERRDAPSGTQYAIAKELDPSDPTPWLYNAIRLQLDNQPIAALRDLDRSVKLNDNRAPFRSRLLLDEDQATRGVSLGRIYDDLGFRQLGVNEAVRSLALDPASSGAHRFLAELYQGVPRLEIARASETLQAQLLQPVGLNPIQPSLAFTDLNIVARGGPARAGFNEFTPLFQSDGVRLDATGLAGTDETWGDEVAVTTLFGQASLSAGQFHYQTDGFRKNNDLQHNIYAVFGQAQVTDELGIQAELRRRETDRGDRVVAFDTDIFRPTVREETKLTSFRVGATLRPLPDQTAIFSAIVADSEDSFSEEPGEGESTDFTDDPTGGQLEFRHIAETDWATLSFGGGVARIEADQRLNETSIFFPGLVPIEGKEDTSVREIYSIASLHLAERFDLLFRFGREVVELEETESEAWTPGIGLIWTPLPSVDVRLAAARTIQKPSVADQSIRPTELAGLNLVYDEFEGTRSDSVGGQVTWQALKRLRLGGSMSRRWMARELLTGSDLDPNRVLDDQREDLASLFAYATLTDRVAVSFEPTYESYRRKKRDTAEGPIRVHSLLLPISARWFDPSGLFAAATSTAVFQELDSRAENGIIEQHDSRGLLVDLAVGYRLPRRRGIFAVEVTNLLDTELDFQDESFRAPVPEEVGAAVGRRRFLPSRAVVASLTLAF